MLLGLGLLIALLLLEGYVRLTAPPDWYSLNPPMYIPARNEERVYSLRPLFKETASVQKLSINNLGLRFLVETSSIGLGHNQQYVMKVRILQVSPSVPDTEIEFMREKDASNEYA